MRNSALPFVAAMTVACLLVMRMASLPTAEPGSAGPELANGIFRLVKQTRLRLPSGAVSATNAITPSAAGSADGQASERWRVVVVADEDHAPLTAALVLALSERLTEEGSVVLIDTLRERPLQLPADRVLRVSTRSATLPEAPGGACSAELTVVDRLLAFPPACPAAVAALPIAPPLSVRYAISHSSHGVAGATMHWGAWYAAVGRSMADELLARMSPGLFSSPTGAAAGPGAPAAAGAPAHRIFAQRTPRADWQSPLPAPPYIEPVRWFGALQEELVRGWIGELPQLEIIDEHGVKTRAIEHLELTLRSARVVKEAAWTLDEHSSAEMRMWNRDQDCLVALKRADGWDLLLWQQRPGIVALYRDWLEQAKGGSSSARALLTRYRAVAAIPADERAQGEQLLDGGR